MNDSSRLFFTGNTLEQAVLTAATHYGIEPDELAYERVERRTGFLRGRRRIVIRVDSSSPRLEEVVSGNVVGADGDNGDEGEVQQPETQADFHLNEQPAQQVEEPRREEQPRQAEEPQREQAPHSAGAPRVEQSSPRRQQPRPRRERSGRGRRHHGGGHRHSDSAAAEARELKEQESWVAPDLPEAEGEVVDSIDRGVQLIAQLADIDLEAQVFEGEEQLIVELDGEDQHRLIRSEGRLLLAAQHLLPRMVQGLTGEMTPCRVDSKGFRERRVANLERLASKAADEVRQSERPKTLRSMNPADRRTIHMALKDDEDVVTESEGHGFFKRITVRPV